MTYVDQLDLDFMVRYIKKNLIFLTRGANFPLPYYGGGCQGHKGPGQGKSRLKKDLAEVSQGHKEPGRVK